MAGQKTQRTADFSGDGKNMVVAYLLWWFLGTLGIHRFYLDRPKTGLVQLLLLACPQAREVPWAKQGG